MVYPDYVLGTGRFDVDRRDFLRSMCLMAAAAVGLPSTAAAEFLRAAAAGRKPSVVWLHFQECTGCTESLLRTTHPSVGELILDLISLDYHETLLVAAGHQAEAARRQAMAENAGRYILVVEGSIPTKDGGIYCKIGGQTAMDMLRETAEGAGAIVAIGSCASWGGIPSSGPNPTGAQGAPAILEGRTVVTIPGCPPNPYNFLGTALQYATYGTLPELDDKGRPKFAYGSTIHEDCPRRAHFDAGRFAHAFGDEGHREGYCLYLLGCKGPYTHAPCATSNFGEIPGAWPIGVGHPCFGCTEEGVGFTAAVYETLEPPPSERPILGSQLGEGLKVAGGGVDSVVAGATGLVGGALLATGIAAARKGGAEAEDAASPEAGGSEA